ncbi:hypothetical protein U6A24_02570 [Aquimarina gracilis]|uniref:DnaA-like protein n=1 Tax=Aquimarina gracilis TaxID=874422 RepID=A0ABU5ZQH6_9FLAO|nr:hypothetical protein [Aquimarina gracilis]MEB3344324.1 hypothetical protein [Aquimarina gracilis]
MTEESVADIFISDLRNYNGKDKLIFIVKYINKFWMEIDNDLELQLTVSRSFSMCIHRLRKKYSIYSYKSLINSRIPILDKYNLIEISLLFIEKQLWEEIILHELSLSEDSEIEFKINYYLECIRQLPLVILEKNTIDFSDFPDFDFLEDPFAGFETDENGNTHMRFYVNESTGRGISISNNEFLISSLDFSVPLQEYENFIESMDTSKLNEYRKANSIERIDNIEQEYNVQKMNKTKLILNSIYKQRDLLKLLSSYQKKWFPNINMSHFVTTNVIYQKEMPDDHYLQNKLSNKKIDHTLSKEEVQDLIGLFKYLKNNDILINSRKINSDRKITRVILDYFSFETQISYQTIRKQLSSNSQVELAKEIQASLNYFKKT